MGYDLFISYASPDLKFAEALHSRLTDAGFSVWFDKARLNPGCDWHKEIEAACEASRVILPVLTPGWKQSEWTRYESYGHDQVIPLVFEGSFLVKDSHGEIDEKASVSTPPLRQLQAKTIDSQRMDDHDWPRLVAAIRSALAAPIPEPGKRLTRMRYGHTENFVGREDKLNEIHEKLWTSPTAALTQGQVQVVTALGGVGKTTLARAYADRFWRLYPQAFWVDCRLGIETEFAAVFDLLFPEHANAGLGPNEKAKRAFDELNQSAARPMRLLVLDDAPDEQAVLSWIPRAGRCHTVITSRFAGWSNPREACNVWVLEAEPARRLLLIRAGRSWEALNSDERAAVDRLAELLGYLPLALEQAAAYIGAPGTSCSYCEYIRRFETAQKHFLSQQQSRGSTEYPASVYATWRTTIDYLPAGSRAILRMAAFMAPTPIPQALWVKSASIVEALAREIGPLPDDRPPVDIQIPEWIADLARYSMVQTRISGGDSTLTVHGLVQAVERHSIAHDAVPIWILMTRASLIAYVPYETAEDPKTWPVWDVLRPHAEALVNLAKADQRVEPDLKLLVGLSQLYYGKALYPQALLADELAQEVAERRGGAESADFAYWLLSRGENLRVMGRYSDAEAAFRKSLAIREKLDGPKSLSVASELNYLALAVGAQGREGEAEQLLRRALAIYESEPNADKHDFGKLLNNLASCLYQKGALDEAERMCRRALSLLEEVLGSEHPHTLIALADVAHVLTRKGDYAAAEPLFRRALEGTERVLGPEHPHTLLKIADVASLLDKRGDYAAAEPLYRRALEARERVLGPEHPDTLTSVNNLASVLESKGDYAAAEPLYRRALEAGVRVLGAEHPDTLTSVNNLAGLLGKKGDYAAAEALYRRALEASVRALGAEHPKTRTIKNNLAYFQNKKGDYAAAEPLYRRVLNFFAGRWR